MDLPTPVEQPGLDPPPDPIAVQEETPPAPPTRPASLAEVQAELEALTARVDALAGSFETVVRAAVTEEVQRVAGELQHTVAALGRVLVRDLGRLNQILTQHRDAILAELKGPPAPGRAAMSADPKPAESAGTGPERPGQSGGTGPERPGQSGETGPGAEADGSTTEGADSDKGRHWRRRKA